MARRSVVQALYQWELTGQLGAGIEDSFLDDWGLEGVDQEYMLVQFTDFGPSSLDVFLYYFAATTVWKEYLDVRERINLKIMACLTDMGLEMAFPTQTMEIKGDAFGTLKKIS